MRHRFAPQGHTLALAPSAFGLFFDLAPKREVRMCDNVAVVDIHGPLMSHPDFAFDSYAAIKIRVCEAVAQRPKAIVLSIDSPGGLVAGCFEAADEIRALCEKAGVVLYAYVEGMAASAAYGLACAASWIVAPETAVVGSIGVIDAMMDLTLQDAAMGTKFTFITSGTRKADGNPHVMTTEAAVQASQVRVDKLASVFFARVAAARGLAPEAVQALEANQFIGTSAQDVGLVDDVSDLDSLLAMVATGANPGADREGIMATKSYEECIAGLREVAAGDDADAAAKAKRMLKAELDEEPDGDEEPAAAAPPDGPPKPPVPPPAAPPKPDAESASALAKQALAAVAEMKQMQAKANESAERATLLASRPDFSKETLATMAKASLEVVRDAVATWPRGVIANPAAAAAAVGTQGAGADAQPARLPAEEKARLDVAMGLVATQPGMVSTEHRLTLGVPVPLTK